MDIYPQLWRQAKALVILKIIFDLGRPAQRKEIIAATHGDDETISYYLNTLSTMGLITRVHARSGFALTAQGFDFMQPKTEKPSLIPDSPVLKDGNLPLINTTTTTKDSAVVEVLTPKTVFYAGNLRLFEEIGIDLTPQTEFIANHVDPETTRAEWRKLSDKGKPWPGLLIKILSSRPRRTKEQQLAAEQAEARRRYAQWDSINRKP
jgi:hypothetical protein